MCIWVNWQGRACLVTARLCVPVYACITLRLRVASCVTIPPPRVRFSAGCATFVTRLLCNNVCYRAPRLFPAAAREWRANLQESGRNRKWKKNVSKEGEEKRTRAFLTSVQFFFFLSREYLVFLFFDRNNEIWRRCWNEIDETRKEFKWFRSQSLHGRRLFIYFIWLSQ